MSLKKNLKKILKGGKNKNRTPLCPLFAGKRVHQKTSFPVEIIEINGSPGKWGGLPYFLGTAL